MKKDTLFLAVTSKCNLECDYCISQGIDHRDVLNTAQWQELLPKYLKLGFEHIILGGGEPLLREDIGEIVQMIKNLPGLKTITLNSNGSLISKISPEIAKDIDTIRVKLDTLNPGRYKLLTRLDILNEVLIGIERLVSWDHNKVVVQSTLLRGVNEDELAEIGTYCQDIGAIWRLTELSKYYSTSDSYALFYMAIHHVLDRIREALQLTQLEDEEGLLNYISPQGFKVEVLNAVLAKRRMDRRLFLTACGEERSMLIDALTGLHS